MNWSSLPPWVKEQMAELDTPYFLFDLDQLARTYQTIQDQIQPDRTFFAVKAAGRPEILARLAALGCGFEINNLAELDKIVRVGVKAGEAINSSPITPAMDVRTMYQRGVRHFAFDSRDQVDNLAANAPGSRVYLRLYTSNKGSKLDLSKRLGVHHADAPELLTYAAQSGLEPFGLTFHVGSQCSEIQNWETGIRVAARLFERFSSLDTLNLGGGFPVPYNESVVSLDQINHTIQAALADSFPRRPRLWVEPGRFLMGPAAMIGASVTQVEDRKPVARAVVDMSLFTGLMEKLEFKDGFEYPIETDAEGKNGSYTLLGPTCDGEDVLAVEIPLPRLHVDHRNPRAGSRIFIGNTGAYTLEYSPIDRPHGFNGARVPSVWFLETGRIRLGGEW